MLSSPPTPASLKYIQSQICFEVADAVEKFCIEILGQYATRERDQLLLPYLFSSPPTPSLADQLKGFLSPNPWMTS
jgi:hypothetical protein